MADIKPFVPWSTFRGLGPGLPKPYVPPGNWEWLKDAKARARKVGKSERWLRDCLYLGGATNKPEITGPKQSAAQMGSLPSFVLSNGEIEPISRSKWADDKFARPALIEGRDEYRNAILINPDELTFLLDDNDAGGAKQSLASGAYRCQEWLREISAHPAIKEKSKNAYYLEATNRPEMKGLSRRAFDRAWADLPLEWRKPGAPKRRRT